jgi:exosortase N
VLFKLNNFFRQKWKGDSTYFSFIVLVVAIVFAGYFNRNYFLFSGQIIFGILVFPFLIKPNSKQKEKIRYALLFGIFLALALFLKLQILLFLAWGFLLLFIVEYYFGSIGYLPFFFIMAISPALYYLVNIFSFPIRLYLSELTCFLFNLAGFNLKNKGSYFVLENGMEFHVDQACVGLKMFGSGLIAAILIMAFKNRKEESEPTFLRIAFWLLVMVFLLLVSNLLRIMGLVFFKSPPSSLSHQIIGLLSLIIYSIGPFYFLIQYFFVKERELSTHVSEPSNKMFTFIPMALLFLAIGSSFKFNIDRRFSRQDLLLENLVLPGFTKNKKEDGVMEFKNDSFLIYIKPAIRPFEGGHPPQICWNASGFELCNFEKIRFGNHSYMAGTLKKNNLQQFTIWWYDNGSCRTVNEWEWRRNSGKPFRVVNVCGTDSISVVEFVKNKFSLPIETTALTPIL